MMIPVSHVNRENQRLKARFQELLGQTIDKGYFIGGQGLQDFERNFGSYVGKPIVGCSNGTDAISLLLASYRIGMQIDPSHERHGVIIPAVSAYPTAVGILRIGAFPIFADVNPKTGLLDVSQVEALITPKTCAIMPVSLYGNSLSPSAWEFLERICQEKKLYLFEDAAQSTGTIIGNRMSGSVATHGATFSFYPTKNLGAMGDGGAVAAKDIQHQAHLNRIREYGQSRQYYHDEFGWNSRLDTFQAMILDEKLKMLPTQLVRIQKIHEYYLSNVRRKEVFLETSEDVQSSFHQTVIKVQNRDETAAKLKEKNIATGVHYPISMPDQKAALGYSRDCPQARTFCNQVLSIPGNAELTDNEVEHVVSCLNHIL